MRSLGYRCSAAATAGIKTSLILTRHMALARERGTFSGKPVSSLTIAPSWLDQFESLPHEVNQCPPCERRLCPGYKRTIARGVPLSVRALASGQSLGRIAAIHGSVVDIEFAAGMLPAINEAVSIERDTGQTLVAEVHQHLGP